VIGNRRAPRSRPPNETKSPKATSPVEKPARVTPLETRDSGESVDAMGFIDFIRRNGKPGLVALIGNAFACRRRGRVVTFHLDKSNANLIMLLKSPQNIKALEDLSEGHFGKSFDIQFAIGSDPKLIQQQKREDQALEIVQSNPVVRYVMDQFKGTILSCRILDGPEEQ